MTIRPTELEKRDNLLLRHCRLKFKLCSSLLQCSDVSSLKIELKGIIYKSEKIEKSKPFGTANKDKNNSIFVFYHGRLVFRLFFFFCFYNALDISSPKIKSLRQKHFTKIGQDGSEKISINQDRKAFISCDRFYILS